MIAEITTEWNSHCFLVVCREGGGGGGGVGGGGIVLQFLTGTTGGIVMQLILGCNSKTTVMFL